MSAPRGFIGTAAVFNQRAAIGDPKTWGFWEEIGPHAFDGALRRKDDTRLLVDHNPSLLLARVSSGTLRLSVDSHGLQTRADLPDTQLGRDTAEMIARRDLAEMSFAFIPTEIEWSTLDDGTDLVRILDAGELFDVSVVTWPAYSGTKADLDYRGELARLRARKPLSDGEARRERWEKAAARIRHHEASIRLEDLERAADPLLLAKATAARTRQRRSR